MRRRTMEMIEGVEQEDARMQCLKQVVVAVTFPAAVHELCTEAH
jgi:hypothetical protein